MAGKTRKHRLRQKKSRKRYTAKGGRYLGKGSYGCTFGFPPLKCIGEPARKSAEYISKYLVKDEARTEGIKSKWFKKFDPSDTYFLTASTICDLDTADIKASDEFVRCHIPIAPGNKLVFFKNAGIDLRKFRPTPDQLIPFYKSLPHLFDGLSLAHRNRTYHRDIKLENVVTMQTPDGRFLTRFIDLGLGVTHPIKKITAASYYADFYVYWPFDVYFMYRDYTTVSTRLNRLLAGEDFSARYPLFLEKIEQNIYGVWYPFFKANGSPFTSYDQMATILMSPENRALSLEKRIELADIYSLGILILQCFRYLGISIKDDGVAPQAFLNITDGFNFYEINIDDLSHLPFSFEPDVFDWIGNVTADLVTSVLELVKSMCHPDPIKRMTLELAKLFYVTEVLPKVELYLTGPQVQAMNDELDVLGYKIVVSP